MCGKLGLVGRGHDDHAGQATEIGEIEGAGMRRSVGAHKPSAIEHEAHWEALDRHVVHHLVIRPLQECRIDGDEGLQSLGGEAGSERYGVLFRDADVERASRKFAPEDIEAGAAGHRCGNRHDVAVAPCGVDERVGKYARERRRRDFRLLLDASYNVEPVDAVILVTGRFRGRVSPAFLGYHMNEDRARICIARVAKHRQQVIEVMAIDRADIVKAQLLEQRPTAPVGARELLRASRKPFPVPRQPPRELPRHIAQIKIRRRRRQPCQIRRHSAHRWSDRHVVVVEDDDQTLAARTGVVHRLISHAGRHGAVTDHAHHVVFPLLQGPGDGHAEPRRDRRRRVRGAEWIVFAFRALREAPKALRLGATCGSDCAGRSVSCAGTTDGPHPR
jgi:hypothetical protein